MKKVLIVHVPYEYRGGEDQHVDVLLKAYAKIGMIPLLYPPIRTPPSKYCLKDALASLHPFATSVEPALEKLIQEEKPDALHLHHIYPLLGPRFLRWCAHTGLQTLMTVHNHRFFCTNGLALREGKTCKLCLESKVNWHPILRNCNNNTTKSIYYSIALSEARLQNLFSRAIQTFIAPSAYIQSELESFGIETGKIKLVPNPLAYQNTVSSKTTAITADIFYAGRLSEEKGIRTLLGAAALLPQYRFVLAGQGQLQDLVQSKQSYELNVTYLGSLNHSEVLSQIKNSKICILPSQCNEILPSFAIEAFIQGKICIVPDLPSTRWLSQGIFEGCGILAETTSAAKLAEKIQVALEQPSPNPQQVESVREWFSFERFCDNLKPLFF